jgi:chromosome partitioning protein
MTVFDPLEEDLMGGLPSMSHVSARQEYRALVDALNLPVSDRARQRKLAREEWAASAKREEEFGHLAEPSDSDAEPQPGTRSEADELRLSKLH